MSIKKENKRVKIGQKLQDIESQAMSSISSLKTIKSQVNDLKQTMSSDNDFKQEDTDEVQALADKIVLEISNI